MSKHEASNYQIKENSQTYQLKDIRISNNASSTKTNMKQVIIKLEKFPIFSIQLEYNFKE